MTPTTTIGFHHNPTSRADQTVGEIVIDLEGTLVGFEQTDKVLQALNTPVVQETILAEMRRQEEARKAEVA